MPKTLLLADDSVTIQKVVGISFANEDVALLTVDNGDDAIAQARETRPDIVLADVVMPGMNGYEVCQAIKSDPQLQSTPVLLLTGTFEAFDEERAAKAGADGHITKPFEAQALVDQVNVHLAQAAAPAPAVEPAPVSASPAPLQETPGADESLGLSPAMDASSEEESSFDFFDEEITEPRTTREPASSAETMVVGDDLEVNAETEDAFAFEASDRFDEELSTSSPSSPGAEVAGAAEMLEPLAEPEMISDSTVAILPGEQAFSSALTEPPEAPPSFGESDLDQTLGESDLDHLEPEELSVIPAAETPFADFTSSVPEEPPPTRIMPETETAMLDSSSDAIGEALSSASDETLILSDLDAEPLSDLVADEPVSDLVTDEPLGNLVTDEPVSDLVTDEPLGNLVTDEPVSDLVTDEPLGNLVTDEPVSDLVTDEPLGNLVTDEPLNNLVTGEPLSNFVSDEPLSNFVSDEPVGDLATGDSVSDLVTGDSLSDLVIGDALESAGATPPEGHATDPLAELEADDLAVEAVLDPAGGRDYDVSSSDLGDPLQGPGLAPEPAAEDVSSPWMAEPPAFEEAEVLSEPAFDEAPEPAPDLLLTPAEEAPSASSEPDVSALTRQQLHDALEKVAWEAFSDVTERIVKEALERIERVAWEVFPQMAESLILEEIRKLKGEDS